MLVGPPELSGSSGQISLSVIDLFFPFSVCSLMIEHRTLGCIVHDGRELVAD
jgi:hypothetical protein